MKKMCLLLVVCLVWMGGCSQSEESAGSAAEVSSQDQKPVVYVSNYPLQYFVERIAPWAEVRFPADVSGDPAYWKPTAEDISEMQKADAIVLNGASYETWLNNVSLSPNQLVDTSARLRDRFIPLEGKVTHSHGLEGEHEHFGTAFTLWLDMTLAQAQVQTISLDFAARWPERTAGIEQAATALLRDLHSLDEELTASVSAAPDLPVLFSHPVYQYLEKRYGINGKSVHWEPDIIPDGEMWHEFEHVLEAHPARWMIWEGDPDPEISAKLADREIQSVVFDPCAGIPEQGDFFTVMQKNVSALQTVFSRK